MTGNTLVTNGDINDLPWHYDWVRAHAFFSKVMPRFRGRIQMAGGYADVEELTCEALATAEEKLRGCAGHREAVAAGLTPDQFWSFRRFTGAAWLHAKSVVENYFREERRPERLSPDARDGASRNYRLWATPLSVLGSRDDDSGEGVPFDLEDGSVVMSLEATEREALRIAAETAFAEGSAVLGDDDRLILTEYANWLLDHPSTHGLAAHLGAHRQGQYVASMRRAMGRSVVELASDASGAIDPVAVVLMEHGRLSDEELNVNLLSGVATALRMPVSVLREIRDSGTAVQPVQPVAGEAARGATGLLHRILVSLGPIARPMANVLGSATTAPSTADLDLHVLERPVLLVSFRADVSDGKVLEVTPVLEPDHDRTPGYSTLVVRVHDVSGSPVVGLRIRLDLLQIEGLEDEEPVWTTGADGIARFPRVPLSRFVELDDEGVRASGADQAYPITLLD